MAGNTQRPRQIRARAVTLGKNKSGPIGYTLTGQGVGMAVLKNKAAQNRVMKVAFKDMGDFWINNFLPLRFSLYAEQKLLYKRSSRKKNTKAKTIFSFRGQSFNARDPLVRTGKLVGSALRTANSKGTPKGARVTFTIPHALRKKELVVLKEVPGSEVNAMAKRMEETLPGLINEERVRPPTRRSRRVRR